MAITVYPLDDIDYVAADVSTYLSTRTSGIYAGDDFAISMTGSDNTISIDTGLAWMRLSKFNGIAVAVKAKTSVDMGIPDATYPRIDALVLRFDANKNGAELIAKSGIASSNPQPPTVSQTEALYELHLLHILRQPGAASITAADVTDLRLDEGYCGLMADAVTKVDTAAINAQISALIQNLRTELEAVEKNDYYASKEHVQEYAEQKKLVFTNTVVPVEAFAADGTYEDYPLRAAVALSGVIESMIPEVIFALPEAVSSNFAPVAACYNGGVYLYASDKPEGNITVPVIICWKGNA